MTETAKATGKRAAPDRATARRGVGVLPFQAMKALIADGQIRAATAIPEAQIQPASMDLRLGPVAYRVRGSFLPGPNATVMEKIERFRMHAIDLSEGAVLEKGCVYIVPLLESLRLGGNLSGLANPKSSAGRLDIFTRLITDHATEFDRVRRGYRGPLYAEISPRAFSVVVREGSRLNQLRLRHGAPAASGTALWRLHEEVRLVDRDIDRASVSNGIPLTVDLKGDRSHLIGYKARPHTDLIDVDRVDYYDPLDYWEPIHARGPGIILNPGDFYILASKETVTVPPDHAAEMVAYDTLVGEFRVHYAGFFDPGFGYAADGGAATKAVLEVRSHEVPFMIEDGQIMGRLMYERLTEVPDKLYGLTIGSSYQQQRLALSKQFRRPQ